MAYETVGDLIKAFRDDERDTVQPYFWSDGQLVRWANEALTEFAERTESIYDTESPVTRIDYAKGEGEFALDPCVLDVVGAWVEGHRRIHLVRGPFRHDWPCHGFGTQLHFDSVGILRLHPVPALPGTLKLQVIRRPLRELDKCDRIPDILPTDRRHLLGWMAYKAYRVNEGDTYNRGSSDEHLQRFEEACQAARERGILRRGDCSRPIRSHW